MHTALSIHCVENVTAKRYYPSNANSVTLTIETRNDGIMETVLYFGYTPEQASKAAALFYALGGLEKDVVKY